MTLLVEGPDLRTPERNYTLSVLLGEFLGLSWRYVTSERSDIRITLEGQPGEIRLPDILLSVIDADWLSDASMPQRPVPQWDSRDVAKDMTLIDPLVPVIYGDREPCTRRDRERISLPVDVFGSAFFMLSRYEELVTLDRDEHDRFPAWASVAYKEGFLERPIVDEYVEILWAAMSALWPRLERKRHTACTFVSCDVDNPYAAYTKSWNRTIRKVGGDLLKRRSPAEAARSLRNTLATRRGDYRHDPFWTFDWMMDVNERAGNQLAFYFLMDHTVPGLDGHYSPDEPRIRRLMRRINERGHEIGVHGSYATYRDPDQMQHEVERLRSIMADEKIQQYTIGGRQHYLRWSSAETPAHLDAAGLAYDTTLSFADHPGFRCGTCREYAMFSLSTRTQLNMRQRPLVVMECSLLSNKYQGVTGDEEAMERFSALRQRSELFGGDYTLLWHNSWLTKKSQETLYERVVTPE